MEPVTLATAVVGLLAPYLAKAREVIAKRAGEVAWDKMKDLYAAVQKKLKDDAYAEETLKRLEENPESKSRRVSLTGVLEEQIEDDPTFAKVLQKLLTEAKEAGAETITQQVTVSDHAKTGNITQIGKVEGNVDLGKKK